MPAPRIVVTRRIPEPALDLLRGSDADLWISEHDRPLETGELHQAVSGADAVVSLLHDRVDDAFLDAAGPQLRSVSNVAVGYDNIDVPAATARGVVVTNTPGVLTEATADIAMGLVLMATRRLGEGERLIRSGAPWSWHMFFMLGSGLQGKTIGIVGLGGIGQAVARTPSDPEVEAELEAERMTLDALLAQADVVSLHLPLSEETRHLIGAEALGRMKSGAYLINTARGPVVDEAALADALKRGEIAGAGLDVFENEPDVHPALLELENVVLVPHLGSATKETRTAMAELAARNALAVTADEPPLTPVTPEVSQGSRP